MTMDEIRTHACWRQQATYPGFKITAIFNAEQASNYAIIATVVLKRACQQATRINVNIEVVVLVSYTRLTGSQSY